MFICGSLALQVWVCWKHKCVYVEYKAGRKTANDKRILINVDESLTNYQFHLLNCCLNSDVPINWHVYWSSSTVIQYSNTRFNWHLPVRFYASFWETDEQSDSVRSKLYDGSRWVRYIYSVINTVRYTTRWCPSNCDLGNNNNKNAKRDSIITSFIVLSRQYFLLMSSIRDTN